MSAEKKPNNFKPINFREDNWNTLRQRADRLAEEMGLNTLSLATYLMMASSDYEKRRETNNDTSA